MGGPALVRHAVLLPAADDDHGRADAAAKRNRKCHRKQLQTSDLDKVAAPDGGSVERRQRWCLEQRSLRSGGSTSGSKLSGGGSSDFQSDDESVDGRTPDV